MAGVSATALEVDDTRRIEQARTAILYLNAPMGVVASCTTGVLAALAFALDDHAIAPAAGVWAALLLACMAFHLEVCRRYRRVDDPDPAHWTQMFVVAALFEGLTWGAGAFLFASSEQFHRQLVMLVLCSGIVASTAFVLSTNLRPFRAFFYPAILPQVVVQLLFPYPLHELALFMTVAFVVSITVATETANAQVLDVLRLRFRNEALAEALAVAKDRAEQANLAKSRFLAAASHDLRQPMHALGLFVGALQGRAMDAEAQRLVGYIDGSVKALDDQFAALLDVSRLDAGVVEPVYAAIHVQTLLERVCRDHAGQAQARGVRFRQVETSAVVRSDPVLLERMVRNLVANAVRYTERGRVLVGCRRQQGVLVIEVWDTGCGIPLAEQSRVFEEFYQAEGRVRDRAEGLGLGLAIVRRIAALVGVGLSFESMPGRGSVFRLRVPLGEDDAGTVPEPAPEPVMGQGSGLVFVIDDEPAIRGAMSSLLTSWGYRVRVAESAAALLQGLPADAQAPDLVISDFRLQAGEDGISAIRAVHARFGLSIPALLITGDTAPERIVEARAGGFPLLHKPLPNGRLRAVIGNLLRSPEA
jgi:signal transduction histidine kinase